MTNINNPTPENLRNLRISRGLSMQELADLLQVDKSTIYRWEHGETKIKQITWISVQSLLNGMKNVGTRLPENTKLGNADPR